MGKSMMTMASRIMAARIMLIYWLLATRAPTSISLADTYQAPIPMTAAVVTPKMIWMTGISRADTRPERMVVAVSSPLAWAKRSISRSCRLKARITRTPSSVSRKSLFSRSICRRSVTE